MTRFIERTDYLMGRDIQYPPTEDQEVNTARLLFRVNALLTQFKEIVKLGGPVQMSSGYRPGHFNAAAGGAAKSAHLTCEAVDVADASGDLKKYIITNYAVLDKHDLYMEDPAKTPTWCHLQTRPTTTRIFKV